ncbi:MAG: VWA domain-containing protein [Actinomycetota bacterium]
MWPQLVGAPAWRRRPSRSGEFDLRHTLRSSVTLGGVPAVVRRRGPATTRPDLVVLVDTSVSMRPSARLMLHLVHALRRRPGRVRVLAFVDECVDVTDVVRHADLAMALGTLLDDAPGGVLDPARSSDYGTALASLWHRYARVLRPSTTVLILGDGRSNGRAPGFDLVADLTARCRRTVWCSPEPEGAWGFGNGEMAAYAERVDAAISVRSLDQLAGAIELGVFARHPVGPGRRGDGPRPDWVATAG